ncbi:MAG TPA: MotA/TolQ/ExbB proton channel family protein [Candidatus Babeliales bacterium]|jgi:biopolymer transport protein TolQ|nr:MotA/TolQ/ExbB proton channel family protein [Candidatus Babeliales bacterium]
MNIFSGNSLWQLVAQSDAISKLVLLLLLAMSIACWAIFIGKLALLHMKERQFKNINKKMQSAKNSTDLVEISTTARTTAPSYFISKNLTFLKELYGGSVTQKIDAHEWEMLERNIDNTIETMISQNEEYLPFLSSCAAVAPLLGLFGTVWGLVHAFIRISETQVADIATIAPGIAEALITTLAGLMVAIPALIMFNYLHTKTGALEHNLILLADRMTFILQQHRGR